MNVEITSSVKQEDQSGFESAASRRTKAGNTVPKKNLFNLKLPSIASAVPRLSRRVDGARRGEKKWGGKASTFRISTGGKSPPRESAVSRAPAAVTLTFGMHARTVLETLLASFNSIRRKPDFDYCTGNGMRHLALEIARINTRRRRPTFFHSQMR